MTIEERRGTAIHEAGHVVVAWALGLPVGSMQIGCHGDDTAGRSEIDESARQLSLIDRIALCIAGVQAQLLFGCKSTHQHAGASDFGKIIEMLDGLSAGRAANAVPTCGRISIGIGNPFARWATCEGLRRGQQLKRPYRNFGERAFRRCSHRPSATLKYLNANLPSRL